MSEPLRVFTIDVAALDGDDISLGDLLDVCEYADCSPDDLGPLLNDPRQGVRRLRAMIALAWVMARKDDPGLTLAAVLAGRIEVIGEGASEGAADPTQRAGDAMPPAQGLAV